MTTRQPLDPASLPRSAAIERIDYTKESIARIADLLEIPIERAPFRLPSATVWQLTVPGTQGRPAALLTLWPSLHRIDVIAGPATVVFTDVRTVDLVSGVEAQFRRGDGAYLIVARGGKVIVRA